MVPGSSIHPFMIGDFSRADLYTWKERCKAPEPAIIVPFEASWANLFVNTDKISHAVYLGANLGGYTLVSLWKRGSRIENQKENSRDMMKRCLESRFCIRGF